MINNRQTGGFVVSVLLVEKCLVQYNDVRSQRDILIKDICTCKTLLVLLLYTLKHNSYQVHYRRCTSYVLLDTPRTLGGATMQKK